MSGGRKIRISLSRRAFLTAAAHQRGRTPVSKSRTCRYLRDLAKRRLGHSHVLNNPASSDGYLQALQVYARAPPLQQRPSPSCQSHRGTPASTIGRRFTRPREPFSYGCQGRHLSSRKCRYLSLRFTGYRSAEKAGHAGVLQTRLTINCLSGARGGLFESEWPNEAFGVYAS